MVLNATQRAVLSGGPAIPDNDIAQFEDGTLHPSYTNSVDWEVNNSSPVLSGTRSLKQTASSSSTISTSGLDNYPVRGQRISCYVYDDATDNTSFPTYLFGVQNESNYYGASVAPGTNEFVIVKDQSDATSRTSASMSVNTWYDAEIEWRDDGTIVLRVFSVDQSTGVRQSEIGSQQISDSEYNSGGIGFASRSSTDLTRFDNYRILEEL